MPPCVNSLPVGLEQHRCPGTLHALVRSLSHFETFPLDIKYDTLAYYKYGTVHRREFSEGETHVYGDPQREKVSLVKFAYTRLVTEDVQSLASFYEKLLGTPPNGNDVNVRRAAPGGRYPRDR